MTEIGASYEDLLAFNGTVNKGSTLQYEGEFSGRFCEKF